jgi:hypothetical protein
MTEDIKGIICDFVDYVIPDLTPYQSTLYLLLLRLSFFANNSLQVRLGKKRIAAQLGKSSRAGATISFAQVTEVFKGLVVVEKGCITIGDTTREGTLYTVLPPREISFVREKMTVPAPADDDYFTEPDKRRSLFERDNWTCQYCGEIVSIENATLDHYKPQSKGGSHSKENLRTCCLVCNSIKSGKSFEEAAPLILKNMQERRQRRKE